MNNCLQEIHGLTCKQHWRRIERVRTSCKQSLVVWTTFFKKSNSTTGPQTYITKQMKLSCQNYASNKPTYVILCLYQLKISLTESSWIPYAQKFPRYVNFTDFTVTYRYSKNLIRENLLVCNN